MSSSIDATKPTAVAALTSDVRANFAAAKAEILALQASVAVIEGQINTAVTGILARLDVLEA